MLTPRPALLSRRATLGTLAAAAISSGLPFGFLEGTGSRLNAAEDAAAPAHKHFFKLSLAAYSFRDALAGKVGERPKIESWGVRWFCFMRDLLCRGPKDCHF